MNEILGEGATVPESVFFGFHQKEHTVMRVEGSDQAFGIMVAGCIESVATRPRQECPTCGSSDGAFIREFEHEPLLIRALPT